MDGHRAPASSARPSVAVVEGSGRIGSEWDEMEREVVLHDCLGAHGGDLLAFDCCLLPLLPSPSTNAKGLEKFTLGRGIMRLAVHRRLDELGVGSDHGARSTQAECSAGKYSGLGGAVKTRRIPRRNGKNTGGRVSRRRVGMDQATHVTEPPG